MLTVCIPYRQRDKVYYDRLLLELNRFKGDLPVKFMSLPNDGSQTIGDYRQILLESVETEWMVYVDADDRVSQDYFRLIFAGIESGKKVIGLSGIITTNGVSPYRFEHSIRHQKWFEKRVNGKIQYFRPPNHLNPIRTEIALQVGFQSLKHGEDMDYSLRLQKSGLLTPDDEYYIEKPIYYYLYRPRK